jgi:hypothetical protein
MSKRRLYGPFAGVQLGQRPRTPKELARLNAESTLEGARLHLHEVESELEILHEQLGIQLKELTRLIRVVASFQPRKKFKAGDRLARGAQESE